MPKLILTENHTQFLNEHRQDPITGDRFLIGDEIIFCASCKSAFHVDSWEYMNGVHCGQNGTLQRFPITQSLKLEKRTEQAVVYSYIDKNIALYRIMAFIIDVSITICVLVVLSSLGKLALLSIPIWIFRDTIFNRSLGKRTLGLYFVDEHTQLPIKRNVLALRAFLFWAGNLIPNLIFYQLNFIAGFIILGLLNFVHFVLLLDGELPSIDTMLGIKLVRKVAQQEAN